MDDQKNTIKRNWTIVLYLIFLFSSVLIGQDLLREIVFFERDLRAFEQNLQEDLEKSLRVDVEAKETLINFQLGQLEEDFRNHVKSNLEELLNVINESLLVTDGQIEDQEIINIVQRHQQADENHQYMLIGYNGDMLYHDVNRIQTSEDTLHTQDVFGRFYYRDMMTLLKDQDEGFINYYLEEDEQIYRYKSFVSKIENKPYFLMTVVQEEHYIDIIKADFVEAVRLFGRESTGEIFIYEKSGVILLHQQSRYEGIDVTDVHEPHLYKAIDLSNRSLQDSDSNYVSYNFYEDGIGSNVVQKIAYVTYIEDLDLVIGSSVDGAYYAPLVEEFKTLSSNRIYFFKIPIYLILMVIAFVIYYFIKMNINRSLVLLKEEEKLYKRFADLTNEIILIANAKGEVIFLNDLGKKTLDPYDTKRVLSIDEMLKEEESYYIMHTQKKTYYVQFKVDAIIYHGEPSKLYVFRDVTESINSLKEIHNVSTKDELTSLGNRRLMNIDFKKKITPLIRDGEQSYLVIMDLDFFKMVNDTYGHVYGDQVLKNVARMMQEEIDDSIEIYRIGGDEFALFGWNISKMTLINRLEKLKNKIETYTYEKPINVSFSAGITTMHISNDIEDLASFYHQADKKLYQAKNKGRNMIID